MSRPLRIEYEGAWYQVMNKGGADRIFQDRNDYQLLIDLMEDITRFCDAKQNAKKIDLPLEQHGNISRKAKEESAAIKIMGCVPNFQGQVSPFIGICLACGWENAQRGNGQGGVCESHDLST